MRLFVAINVPKKVENELIRLGDQLPQDGLKRVDDFHLTLKFLGDVDDEKVPKLVEALHKVKHAPFEISVTGIIPMPTLSHITIVWYTVEPEDPIIDLQGKVDLVLGKWFPLETRFKPHLTMTGIKFLKNKREFVEKLGKITLPKLSFPVTEFELVKSTLTKDGPVYERIAVFALI